MAKVIAPTIVEPAAEFADVPIRYYSAVQVDRRGIAC